MDELLSPFAKINAKDVDNITALLKAAFVKFETELMADTNTSIIPSTTTQILQNKYLLLVLPADQPKAQIVLDRYLLSKKNKAAAAQKKKEYKFPFLLVGVAIVLYLLFQEYLKFKVASNLNGVDVLSQLVH